MKVKSENYQAINIPPSKCPICGKARNQYTNHSRCSKAMQASRAEANKARGAGL